MKKLFLVPLIAFAVWGTACKPKQQVETNLKTLDLANLDTTADLKQNFYQYACGGWMAAHPLTGEYSRYGAFDKLGEDNQEQLKSLIEGLAANVKKAKGEARQIGLLFNIAMDSAKRNQQGITPIEEELNEIRGIENRGQVFDLLVKMHLETGNPFFAFYVASDPDNSKANLFQLYQAGTGLPDRDYYLESGHKAIFDAYKAHVQRMFQLCGNTEEEAIAKTRQVIDIETALAKLQYDRVSLRDPHKNYNRMTVEELCQAIPEFDWKAYTKAISPDFEVKELSAGQIDFMKGMAKVYANADLDALKAYFEWNLINGAASCLSDELTEANFDFYGKVMSGQTEMKPRWKRCVSAVNGMLGEAVGKMYVEKYFPASAKERISKLVENIRLTMGERMAANTWMSDETKAKGQAKLDAILVKVGYPDKWRDYSSLEIKDDSYWANVKRHSRFETEDMLSKLGKPVDRDEWQMSPQTVNAYYNPTTNEICFPAAILQPPFFYPNGDDAINYGGIGVVIAHELTHGFDDKGRLYDKDGNLNDWWNEQDAKNFEARAQLLVDHFDRIEVFPGLMANGSLTLGENIADNGGLNISFAALQKALQEKPEGNIDGFTPAQRFFLSYATLWASNIRDEEIQRLTMLDVHSLGKWRVNGTLPHVDAFFEAFGITENDPMWLAPEKRAHIW
ncbi:MAG: M13 family metallopeptidase [Bacteroidales bacterium]|nr:M13 family metallopeptidase [Bacteroidales bacterium]